MKVVKCDKNHYYDADKYASGCPHCAAGVEPYEDRDTDIKTIYTQQYVLDKKNKKKQNKTEKAEEKRIKKEQKQLQKLSKKSNKSKKNVSVAEDYNTLEIKPTDDITMVGDSDITLVVNETNDDGVIVTEAAHINEKKEEDDVTMVIR